MDVSIIIVNYNTCKMTAECIDSVIEKTTDLSYEIILVDNASTDGSKDFFTNDNRITYLYNDENLGFGRANNCGVKIAKGRNILFLNSDTLLINNAVKIMSDYLDTHNHVGAVGGNLYTHDMRPGMSFQRLRPSLSWEINDLLLNLPLRVRYGKTATYFNTSSRPIKVGYIMGADLMTRKAIVDKIGCFDPQFFMYFEETDLCHRIAKNGYNLHVIPTAKIIHHEGKSFGEMTKSKLNPRKIEMFETSRTTYYQKNYSLKYNRLITIIYKLNLRIKKLFFSIFKKTDQCQAIELKIQLNN